MRIFLVLALLAIVGTIAWRYAPPVFKARARNHLSRNWWIVPVIVILLFALVAVLAGFSIKLF